MTRSTSLRIDLPENQLDPKIIKILQDLREGKMSKKEIANRNRVDPAIVHRVAKSLNFTSTQAQAEKVEEKVEVENTIVIEDEIRGGDKIMKETLEKEEKKWPLTKLSDDLILKIVSDLEQYEIINTVAIEEVAKMNDVSTSSVRRYGKEFGIIGTSNKTRPKNKKKTKKRVSKKEVQVNNGSPKTTVYYRKSTFVCGMFKERHRTINNVDGYVINQQGIYNEDFFDFDKTDEIIEQFILENFKITNTKDGKVYGDKDMILYVTGLSYVLASIIRFTNIYGINLTLMHYDEPNNSFRSQVIWDQFGNDNPYVSIMGNFTSTTWYKCSFDTINHDDFYTIQVVNFSSKNKYDREIDLYIFADEGTMWDQCSKLIKEIMMDKEKKIVIFANKSSIKNNKLEVGTRINRSSNFDFGDNK